jgi:Ca2+-binding RTX toxin-like protein
MTLISALDPSAHDFELYLGNIGQVDADPFDLMGGSRGGAGQDSLFGTTGNDVIDGGAGLDTLYLHVNRADLSIVNNGEGLTVSSAGSGADTLAGVERLNLADGGLAFDFDGGAGHTARLIGAVFGSEYLEVREFVGIGLELFDGGMTMAQVAQLALDTDLFKSLAGSTSNADFVSLVYENVVGMAPSAGELADFVGLLDSGVFTQASLAVLAAETELNELNINLVGLTQTGIDFI